MEAFNIPLGPNDIALLQDRRWLNDEVIYWWKTYAFGSCSRRASSWIQVVNFYGCLIMDRCKRKADQYPDVHFFNSFFYSTLAKDGYDRVRRWTKKVSDTSRDVGGKKGG